MLTKSLLAHFEPLSLLVVQLIASNALLWTLLIFEGKSGVSRLASLKYSLPGLLQPGLAFIFGIFGLNLTSVNSDALLWACESILVIFLASAILKERFSWQLLTLALFGTCGTLMATTPNLDTPSTATVLAGNALIVAGVFCAALYNIYTQRQLVDIEPLRLTSLHQLSGFVLVAGVWLIRLPTTGLLVNASGADFLLALVSGTTQYALSFWLYLCAIKDFGAARLSILLVLPPIFTIWASFVFLKEQLNCWQWLGVFIALSSVTGIGFYQKKDEKAALSDSYQEGDSVGERQAHVDSCLPR